MRTGSYLLALSVLTGCGHGAVLAPEPRIPSCRQVSVAGGIDREPALSWFGPGQADETVRHFQWCRAVGPVVVAGPAWSGQQPVDSLLVVSYNMDLGAASAVEMVDSIRAGALTGGSRVDHFLLLLQETFREGPSVPAVAPEGSGTGRARYPEPPRGKRLEIVRAADSLGLHLFYVPAMRSGRGPNPEGRAEDRGNAILSTLPFDSLKVIDLPFGGLRRVAQAAIVRGRTADGVPWSIEVVNVHFDVGPIGPSALSAIRARQARAVAQVEDGAPAVVVGGDLNSFSLFGTPESVRILARAFRDTPADDGLPTRGGQRLDHLFYRLPPGYRAGEIRRGPDRYGSDHFPVFNWLSFGSGPRSSSPP